MKYSNGIAIYNYNDGVHIEVYGDVGHDCASFSDAGLVTFLKWCKTNKPKICESVFGD